jgi:hypothetical protein
VIPHTYYLQRDGVEEGPLTVAQVNRMKQRRLIAADTLCRADHDSTFRRLDEVLPHLKDYQGLDPEKMSKLKKDMDTFEIRSLTAGAFGSGLLCLAPLRAGAWASLVALVFGGALLFKYRKPTLSNARSSPMWDKPLWKSCTPPACSRRSVPA